MGEARAAGLKSPVDHQQSVKYKSTTNKPSSSPHRVTSFKDRWIGAYSLCLNIPEKLGCPINNFKKTELFNSVLSN
jgi:hypothetical protein